MQYKRYQRALAFDKERRLFTVAISFVETVTSINRSVKVIDAATIERSFNFGPLFKRNLKTSTKQVSTWNI